MSFVNGSEIFSAARKGHYAVGAFNTNNLEWTRAILKGAQEKNVPVLIQVSMGAAKYMGGYKLVRDLVASEMEAMNITVPVVMHLDHGNYEAAKECIEAGFSSVMFDGHDLPFEETLRRHETKPNKTDFGEQDMRRWWKENDFIHIIPEKILTKNLSISDTVDMIYNFIS